MVWHFGPYRLDLANTVLWRGEQPVTLRRKTFALLAYLVQHAGQLVTKEDLFEAVWPGTVVSDGVLKTSMNELRKTLGETAKAAQWIATVHRRGYRFVAPVVEQPDTALPLPEAPPGLPPPPQAMLSLPRLFPHGAERRHLTVLCCELVGATALAARLDPEEYREIVRVYHQWCAEVMQRFDGYVAHVLGDGVLGYFGYPMAHEDDAQRAVLAGLDLLTALAVPPPHALPTGEPLAVRLGVHPGMAVVDAAGT